MINILIFHNYYKISILQHLVNDIFQLTSNSKIFVNISKFNSNNYYPLCTNFLSNSLISYKLITLLKNLTNSQYIIHSQLVTTLSLHIFTKAITPEYNFGAVYKIIAISPTLNFLAINFSDNFLYICISAYLLLSVYSFILSALRTFACIFKQ